MNHDDPSEVAERSQTRERIHQMASVIQTIAVDVAVTKTKVEAIEKRDYATKVDLDSLARVVDKKVDTDAFTTVRLAVYGFVAIVLASVLAAWMNGLIRTPGQ